MRPPRTAPGDEAVRGAAQASPLAEIRALEDRMASRIDAARAAAAAVLDDARRRADAIAATERADAERRADVRARTALAETRAEVDRIRAAAANHAERLLESGQRLEEDAVAAVLAFVLPEPIDRNAAARGPGCGGG
jgi:vacuolar-type H+-ATPase subunit H